MASVRLTILVDANSNDYIVLAVHSYNDAVNDNYGPSFMIPGHVEVGSTYTVYWMWNTTITVNNNWLVS